MFILPMFTSVVFGQSLTWMGTELNDITKNAPWKIGLIRGYGAFSINNFGYDSDIYYGFRTDVYPDLSFTTGPTFQWFVPLKKRIMLESYQFIQGNIYLKNKNERALNLKLNTRLHFLFKRIYWRVGFDYSNIRDRFSPELIMNIRHQEKSANSLILWQLSRSGAIAINLNFSEISYSHVQFGITFIDKELDRRQALAELFLYYQPSSGYRIYLKTQASQIIFLYTDSRIKDSYSYALFGGLNLIPQPGEKISTFEGRFNIGYKYLDPVSALFNDASDLVGDGLLVLNANRWLSFRAFYRRDFDVSVFADFLHFLQSSYGGGVALHLSKRLDLSTQIAQSTSKYPFIRETEASVSKSKFTLIMAGFDIKMLKNLSLGLIGSTGRRITYPDGLKFNRFFIGFNLNYGYVPGEDIVPMPSFF